MYPHLMFSQLAAQHKTLEKRREAKKDASKKKFQQMKAKWSDSERLVRLISSSAIPTHLTLF